MEKSGDSHLTHPEDEIQSQRKFLYVAFTGAFLLSAAIAIFFLFWPFSNDSKLIYLKMISEDPNLKVAIFSFRK